MTPPRHVAVDIAVVGFGGAGAAAAMEAARLGADVLLLEKAPRGEEGGSTRASAQGFLSPTGPGATAVYIEALAAPRTLAPERAARWAAECCENVRWLESNGIPSEPLSGPLSGAEYPELPGAEAIGKRRVSTGDGSLWSALERRVQADGIPVLYGARAVGLGRDARGRVDSVSCVSEDGDRLVVGARRGVVLATGGYAAAPWLLRRYVPSLGLCDTAGSPHSEGDGLTLGLMVGARLGGLDAVSGPYLAFLAPGFRTTVPLEPLMPGRRYPGIDAVMGPGCEPIDARAPTRHGRVPHRGRWGYRPLPPHATYWCDADVLAGGPLVRTRAPAPGWSRVVEGLAWSSDNETEIARGWVERVERGRAAPLRSSHAAAYRVRLSRSILNTHGGPDRDAAGRVVDRTGSPIAGLCSAGELGSIFPHLYQGAGNLADCLVSGRIAVRTLLGADARAVARG